jgi:rubrerythrin
MILVPVDKNPSKRLVNKAFDEAKKHKEDLKFVHIEDMEYKESGSVMTRDKVKSNVESKINGSYSEDSDISYKIDKYMKNKQKKKEREILDLLDHNVSMIIVGHRSLSKKQEKYYNSFAKNIISNTDKPTLVIPD